MTPPKLFSESNEDFDFCTYITFYTGDKLPPFYIGHSTVTKVVDEGYGGSVLSKLYKSTWVKERAENSIAFTTFMLSKHIDKTSANDREGKIQHALDVVRSPLFINMAYAQKGFFFNSEHTEESKKKIGEKASLYRHSKETLAKMSESQKKVKRPKASDETKAKMSKTRKGQKQDPAFVERRIAPLRGRKKGPLPDYVKLKISISNTGRVFGESFAVNVIEGLRQGRGFDYVLIKGDERIVVTSLKAFCAEHKLAYSSLNACFRSGKIHKKSGWFVTSKLISQLI